MKNLAANIVKWCLRALALSIVVWIPMVLFCPPAIACCVGWIIAAYVLVFAPVAVFRLSKYCSKTWLRLSLFAVILVSGSILYYCDFRELQKTPVSERERFVRWPEKSTVAADTGVKTPPSASEKSRQTIAEESFDGTVKPGNCDYLYSVMIGVFSALSEFFPSRGSYREWLTYSPVLKLAFLFFYLFSFMFVASFLLSLLGRKLINRFALLQARFFNDRKHVFWCNVPEMKEKLLADDILKEDADDLVIFSAKESAIKDMRTFVDQMQFSGFLLCLRKPGQLHYDCLTARRHFFLTDDLNWNFRQARKVLDMICAKKRAAERHSGLRKLWDRINFNKISEDIHFFLRVTDDEKTYWAVRWAEKMQKGHKFLTVHLIDEEAIVARQLQLRYPLLSEEHTPDIKIDHDTCKVNGSFRILLLGFSDGGQAVLREMVCNGQFLHTDPRDQFLVDVVDRNEILTSGYAARYRDAVRAYNISFINKEVLSGDFYHWLGCNLHRYNRIVVSFWNDNLNLEIAAIICRLGKYLGFSSRSGGKEYMHDRLYVRFSRSAGSTNAEADPGESRDGGGLFSEFRIFGSIEECYSKKVIIDESLDRKAKRVHRIYTGSHQPDQSSAASSVIAASEKDEVAWRGLDMFTQESNRACADGLRNQLALLDMTEEELDPEAVFDPGNKLETLAETEHVRWTAFHLMHGVRPWPLEDITDEDITRLDHRAKDIHEYLRHAAIVDYAALPNVDKRLGDVECLQDNDRNLIKNMGVILCEGESAIGKKTRKRPKKKKLKS